MFCSILFDLVHSISSDGGSSYNGGGVDGGNSMESWWMRGPIMCGYTLKRRWNVYKNAYMEYGIMWYFIYMKLIARFHTLFRRHWNALANRGETLHTQSWLLLLLVLAGLGKKSGLFDQPACTTLLHIAFVGVCECLVSMCVHVYVHGLRYISKRMAWHGMVRHVEHFGADDDIKWRNTYRRRKLLVLVMVAVHILFFHFFLLGIAGYG